ncbi:MAG: DUF2148 domain-containing protein [Methanomicrobiaceae archaeon]|nr:DUF2148 domain-containing protein [Methanomicrobiaceae archaeon]
MDEAVDAVGMVAHMMALSARTAPKARGTDALVIRVVRDRSLLDLAGEMRRMGEAREIAFFTRDAGNLEKSDACLLVGLRTGSAVNLDCGGCGHRTCAQMLEAQKEFSATDLPFSGPNCAVRVTDLGIALGSAAKTAGLHNVDNRIMYTVGVAALKLGLMEDCTTAYGIPLKAGGKSIFFDRG